MVPYWTTQNLFPVLLGMLVDHPLIMTVSLNILYLPTHPTTPHPLHPKLKLLVAHISGVTSIHKMFLELHNIYSCPLGENQPGEDNSVLQQWHYFCGREETNYLLPDVTSVVSPKFFTGPYEKGCQYSSITLGHSAIASVITLRGYATLSGPPTHKTFHKRGLPLKTTKTKIFF